MSVPQRLRYEVLRRDNHTCRYCGQSAPEVPLEVDHVIPKALGGSDDASNLVTACRRCNRGKASVPADAPIVEDISQDAVRLARAMAEVTAIRSQEIVTRSNIAFWFSAVWNEWTFGRDNKPVPLPDGPEGVLPFIDAGLSEEEIKHFVDVAMRAKHIPPNKTWAYFCGCCWRRIRENVDMAAQLMAVEEEG